MSKISTFVIATTGLMLASAGCQKPATTPEPQRATVPLASDDERDDLWDVCMDVLREHQFQIDRRDRRGGTITTLPVTTQQLVEFWRKDAVTPYDLLESSFHSIRRSVTVQFIPAQNNRPSELEVAVYKERYSAVEREVNNAAGGLRIFDQAVPSTIRRTLTGQRQHQYWHPTGRDSSYESYLMELILDRFRPPATT